MFRKLLDSVRKRKAEARRLALETSFIERGPMGRWTNSMGYSMAPMDGYILFKQDGIGQIEIFMGPEGEFNWARTGHLEFEIWSSFGENRYLFKMTATDESCWFRLVNWELPPQDDLIQEIADTLELGPWFRLEGP